MTDWQDWESAWGTALYGEQGFYRQPEGPAGHFRTAVHAAPRQLAATIARLAAEYGCRAVVDVGAGRGELVRALALLSGPAGPPHGKHAGPPHGEHTGVPHGEHTGVPHGEHTGVPHATHIRAQRIRDTETPAGEPTSRLNLHAVDVVPRPADLPPGIGWSQGIRAIPDDVFDQALVIGWELLDVVPCTVLELDADGTPRKVLVDPATGRERLGEPADPEWARRWWPADELEEGDRIEIGSARDTLWAELNHRAAAAGARLTLAVDYAHTFQIRPPAGSLTGFQRGRAVPPRPDGSMDITAHVAIDSVAAAITEKTGRTTTVSTQRQALRELGVRDTELLDDGGLGGFAWLITVLS